MLFLSYSTSNLSKFCYLYLQNTPRICFSPPRSAIVLVRAIISPSHSDSYGMPHHCSLTIYFNTACRVILLKDKMFPLSLWIHPGSCLVLSMPSEVDHRGQIKRIPCFLASGWVWPVGGLGRRSNGRRRVRSGGWLCRG